MTATIAQLKQLECMVKLFEEKQRMPTNSEIAAAMGKRPNAAYEMNNALVEAGKLIKEDNLSRGMTFADYRVVLLPL